MSRERFQSETGQTIDDNGCLFFASSSPLFYTVNPRSGVSLRQQEQLGAPSILKSFRDLPGCTRLSSSLSNLDASSGTHKRAQFPVLPDINKKGSNMGKNLQGHHSSSKRFVRERYNPPFKVNAKIRHVYTQEVTTAVEGRDQQHTPPTPPSQSTRQQPHAAVTCHRQTQTEVQSFIPEEGKQRQEVEQISEEDNETKKVDENNMQGEKSGQLLAQTLEVTEDKRKVDASTSPIPSPYFTSPPPETISPFTGCSQTSVYPPLNYVRKLEDLEKITGHIVIQRFFTRTDDAFGSWLEKQLGMTSKSVSVDTSEFENAKTAELQDENDDKGEITDNYANGNIADMEDDTVVIEGEAKEDMRREVCQEGTITGAIANPGEGDSLGTENLRQSVEDVTKLKNAADCALADSIRCECYLKEIGKGDKAEGDDECSREVNEIEAQIIPLKIGVLGGGIKPSDISVVVGEVKADDDEVETLVSSAVVPVSENDDNQQNMSPRKKTETEADIDEMVRCTLEAYLMAPMMGFEEIKEEKSGGGSIENLSPQSGAKSSEVDSGRADSILSQDINKGGSEGQEEIEGNTSHDSVETVYEIPMMTPPKHIELVMDETKLENESTRILQRSLSADSCIGTESSGDAKNIATNASQSSNDTIEGLDQPIIAPKELVDLNLGSPASAPPTITRFPSISVSAKALTLAKKMNSGLSQKLMTPASGTRNISRRNEKTDTNAESEDADGESETESEITDNILIATSKMHSKHDGTDLELEEVDEYEGDDDDDRDAFDAMVANHLKYSRGLPTATSTRRSRLNRGTQTTKSIEPSTTSGSLSSCSSSNSSFDVEIISKSKRMTTSSSAGGPNNHHHQDHVGLITPSNSNMTLAWHEGGRRRSYLPSSSSSLNLLNMKFSLGKDFESEVSIRMPASNNNKSSANISSASMLLPGSSGGGTVSGKTLMSSSSRTHHHHYYPNRGLSPGRQPHQPLHSPGNSASTMPLGSEPEQTELQSLWKDVKTKLDVQVDEMASTIPTNEEEITPTRTEILQVKGSGILPLDSVPPPGSGSTSVKLRRNEERIKRSLQRLKKILED